MGKAYSPEKPIVDAAIKYAEKKGLLIIHAAGNDSKDLEKEKTFPHKHYSDGRGSAKNWIEVGASTPGTEGDLAGNFSNYGDNYVDIFAPGVDIYSAVPDQSFDYNGGTSMAAPMVSGLAACSWLIIRNFLLLR